MLRIFEGVSINTPQVSGYKGQVAEEHERYSALVRREAEWIGCQQKYMQNVSERLRSVWEGGKISGKMVCSCDV